MVKKAHVLKIDSNRKGSNPGGFAYLNDLYGYVKFCYSSPSKKTPLKAENQPIYEYITAHVANSFGILTPELLVIRGEDVVLVNEVNNPDFKSKRKYYLFSKFVDYVPDRHFDETYKTYLSFIGVCDVINKGDNYGYRRKDNKPIIIDLGCNFVKAVNGMMHVEPLPKNYSRKKLKAIKKELKNTLVYPIGGKEPIILGEFIDSLPYWEVNMVGNNKKLENVLSQNELEYIQQYYLIQFKNNLYLLR